LSHLFKIYRFYIVVVVIFTAWTVYYRLPSSTVSLFFGCVLILVFERPLKRKNFVLSIIFMIVVSRGLMPYGLSESTLFIPHIVLAVFISSLLHIKDHSYEHIYKMFKDILAIIFSLGLSIHLAIQYFSLDVQPFAYVLNDSGRDYSVYPFFVYEQLYGAFYGLRFSSIFDEAGYLGTMLAFILVIENYNFNKKTNVIFFITGIFTYSLAFYSLTIFGLFLFQRRSRRYIIIVAIIIMASYTFLGDNVNDLIVKRLSIENGEIVGDNRGGAKLGLEMWDYLSNQNMLSFIFGNGFDAYEFTPNIHFMITDSNWGRLVHQLGIFFLAMFLIFSFNLARKRYSATMFMLMFTLSLYQRPQIFTPIMMFIYFKGIRFYYDSILPVKDENEK
jgi:hypothetical protein